MRKNLGKKAVLSFVAMMFAATNAMAQAGAGAWAKFENGTLTFTCGAKPTIPSQVTCGGCGKKIARTHKFCSDCGAKNTQDFAVFKVPMAAKNTDEIPWYEKKEDIRKVVFTPSFKRITNITSTAYWFFYCKKMTSITGLENLNTNRVRCMELMFYWCESLTSLDVSNFNTSNVTNMGSMFHACESLTSLDVSNFNTSNVTDMSCMFIDCKGLTSLDLSNFNTSNATNMQAMFGLCKRLRTIKVSSTGWNLSKAETYKDKDGRKGTDIMFDECPAQIIKE